MTEDKSAERSEEEAREEVEDKLPFTPNPLYVTSSVGTNGSGPSIEETTPIFEQARADALGYAAEHPESDSVILPSDSAPVAPVDPKSDKDAVADLKDAAAVAQDNADAVLDPNTKVTDEDQPAIKSDADKADAAKKASGAGK